MEVINEGPQMNVTDLLPANTGGKPPRAPLAFRVGVVGHRPDRLVKADLARLGEVIGTILSTVKDVTLAFPRDDNGLGCKAQYGGARPLLTAISPLAEGTDRIFAERALDLGFQLCCVLPFHQAEFEKDFAPGTGLEGAGSLPRFQHLLAQATTRFELDGKRTDETGSYGTGGRVVLNQSDLLIVVWDGYRQGKRGGTEETFDEAMRSGVPVIWIDAEQPHSWQFLDATTRLPRVPQGTRVVPNGSSATIDRLRERIRQSLELPGRPKEESKEAKAHDIEPTVALEHFYVEKRPRRNWALVWRAFQSLVGDHRWPKFAVKVDDFEESIVKEWPKDRSTPTATAVDDLRPFYAWADKLSVLYGDRYRSAFLIAFTIAAIAVGLALVPYAASFAERGWYEQGCVISEVAAIILILGLIIWGQHRRWHQRWLDYRLTAELVRHLRLVAPLGGKRPFPQVPAHWAAYGEPGASWMAWYVRALERSLGLPSVVVDGAYLDTNLAHLAKLVDRQIEYHQTTEKRYDRMETMLHACGITLLALTLIACVFHVFVSVRLEVEWPEALSRWLTFFCGFFPALGAAVAGILTQGEFTRITNRSEAMKEQLSRQLTEIDNLRKEIAAPAGPSPLPYSAQAMQVANNTANLLVAELLDWRVILLDQPLRPPG